MKALTFRGVERIGYETVADPKILRPTDVILKVSLAAICGSDLHPYFGREAGLDQGTVMGHELMGTVVETGSEIKAFSVGDRVVSPFTTNCGSCFYCLRGLTCRCTGGELIGWVASGEGLHGAQAEYVRIPHADATLFRLPSSLLDEPGLMLGDILATGYFAAENARVSPDGVYVVVGCGPVGLMGVIAASEMQAGTLFAIDSVPERLELAQRFGAIPLNFKAQDPLATIRTATDGRGADGVMELVGSPAAGRLAMDLLRPGGTLSVVGVHNEPHMAFSPEEAYDKNLTFKVGRCPARHYMERLAPIAESRCGDLEAIISHRLPLEDGPRAYKIFAHRLEGCTKVVLHCDS